MAIIFHLKLLLLFQTVNSNATLRRARLTKHLGRIGYIVNFYCGKCWYSAYHDILSQGYQHWCMMKTVFEEYLEDSGGRTKCSVST